MENFKDVLTKMPTVEGCERIELFEKDSSTPLAIIENKPGQAGSLAVYLKLLSEFGEITPSAAKAGLELFCEHTHDAQNNPEKHPNIDRLLFLVKKNATLSAVIIKK